MTAKEKLLKEAPHFTEAQAKAALLAADAGAKHKAAGEAIADGYRRIPQTVEEGRWALANAREAIREEPW